MRRLAQFACLASAGCLLLLLAAMSRPQGRDHTDSFVTQEDIELTSNNLQNKVKAIVRQAVREALALEAEMDRADHKGSVGDKDPAEVVIRMKAEDLVRGNNLLFLNIFYTVHILSEADL